MCNHMCYTFEKNAGWNAEHRFLGEEREEDVYLLLFLSYIAQVIN